MQRILILLGGGEIREKETLEIDRQIAVLAKKRARLTEPNARGYALFIGTASGDYMPYYNTFHKTYTGVLDMKTDLPLSVYQQTPAEKADVKFGKADMIYVGGGDTVFMLKEWQRTGFDKRIIDAYNRGVIVSGLSAGAICWFDYMYTDSKASGDELYHTEKAMGLLRGGACPHFNLRTDDFLQALSLRPVGEQWLCMENNAAVVLVNERLAGALSCGGRAYRYTRTAEGYTKEEIPLIDITQADL